MLSRQRKCRRQEDAERRYGPKLTVAHLSRTALAIQSSVQGMLGVCWKAHNPALAANHALPPDKLEGWLRLKGYSVPVGPSGADAE
jgi:hypothetical protein